MFYFFSRIYWYGGECELLIWVLGNKVNTLRISSWNCPFCKIHRENLRSQRRSGQRPKRMLTNGSNSLGLRLCVRECKCVCVCVIEIQCVRCMRERKCVCMRVLWVCVWSAWSVYEFVWVCVVFSECMSESVCVWFVRLYVFGVRSQCVIVCRCVLCESVCVSLVWVSVCECLV